MRNFLLLLATFVFINCVYSQQFGGNPPSLAWKQINTDTVRIIYPVGLDSQAQRVAAIVHYLSSQKPVSLGEKIRKINIVLQNQTTIANGYVGLGPFRSEFLLTPVLNNFQEGSISWVDQLGTHEYRHVQQYNNFHQGLSQVMYVLFGEEGFALATNAAVPDWFFEGDAVYNETLLTNQGRGRLPLFLNAYPSLWQANKKYAWMKLRNGSMKDYVPNHYYLGYLLVNYGREKYGSDFWTKVTTDASAYKGLFYPFQKAILKYAGVNYQTFREQAFDYYKQKIERVSILRDQFLLPVNKNYVTDYEFPYRLSTDSLLYLRSSYRHRPAFFVHDQKGEHKIKVKDISDEKQFSYRNGKIVYAAYQTDPRWAWKDYSVIKLLDVNSGKQKKITRKSKYFTPDISPDGSKIAAVQIAVDGRSELHILNANTGAIIKQIHSADISLFTDPKFIDNNLIVTAVRLLDGRMVLATADIASGNTLRLTPPSFNVVGFPCVNGNDIYFTASYGGNDDVFLLRDKKIYRVTNGPLGHYYVNVAAGKITWSVFTAEGYQLEEKNEKDIELKEVALGTQEKLENRFSVSHASEFGDILNGKLSTGSLPVTKYKKGTGLFNFHSYRPYYEDPIFTFSLYGENILNTFQSELYYLYNQDEKTSAVGFNATYGAWFPYLSVGTELTFDRQRRIGNRIRQWNQLDSRIGLNIPLSFTSGTTFKELNIGTNYFYRNDFNQGFYKDSLGSTGFSYLHHYITFTHQIQRATQHIYPRLGYSLSLQHRYAITDFKSWQFLAGGTLYLPGFVSNHNLVLTGAFQETDTLNAVFGNRFAYSRGYIGGYFARMWRASANYHFPIWHPDFGIANIVYIQRIRGNAFYDFTKIYSRNKLQSRDQRSVGWELFADTRWWNQYPLTFGIRVSHLLDADVANGLKGNLFEFVLPVSIFPH